MKKFVFIYILLFSLFSGLINSPVFAGSGENLTLKQKNEQRKLTLKQKQEERKIQLQKKKENTSKPSFGKGTFIVGKDIKSGTYRTQIGSKGCYYTRLNGFGGSMEEIISNEFTNAPAIITINPTDKGFKSSNCAKWTQNLSQITKSKTTFSDGVFLVGDDIDPGLYRNIESKGCYYSRLKSFYGTIEDIISNEFTNEASIITIEASDKGFKSSNCGTWSRIN